MHACRLFYPGKNKKVTREELELNKGGGRGEDQAKKRKHVKRTQRGELRKIAGAEFSVFDSIRTCSWQFKGRGYNQPRKSTHEV